MEKIYFCCKNEFKTKKVYKELKSSFPEMKIKRKGCLGKCKICKSCPFSVLDGKVLQCESSKKLYRKIKKNIS